ncbi:PD-(D/E)XK nuclease family protein [Ampullimonas aquatilis]|uniref:PD-(D/E)XK nuclease family protein n=1 Tax=Ampullimonas aquatilis TaxID=1341549 RepID=UPI003C790448
MTFASSLTSSAQIQTLQVWPDAQFWPTVARAVHQYRNELRSTAAQPTWILNEAFLLVPRLAHAALLKQALISQQAGQACSLPTIHTVHGWLNLPEAPPMAWSRLAMLYEALRKNSLLASWLGVGEEEGAASYWRLARTLLQIADELSAVYLPRLFWQAEHGQALADGIGPVAQQITAILDEHFPQRSGGLSLSDEARLIVQIWQMLVSVSPETDPLCEQLQTLAERLADLPESVPLIWLCLAPPAATERAMLQQVASDRQMLLIDPNWRDLSSSEDLAASVPDGQPILSQLQQAWPELYVADETQLLTKLAEPMAVANPGSQPQFNFAADAQPRLHERISIARLPDREREAMVVAAQVLQWLHHGVEDSTTNAATPKDQPAIKLALIAQDRIVARRVGAMLARANVTVADETGWLLSTSRAAAAVASWLEMQALQMPVAALLDWLKSPFVWADDDLKAHHIARLEALARREQILQGLPNLQTALQETNKPDARDAQTLALLSNLPTVLLSRRQVPLSQWASQTLACFAHTGMDAAFATDAAGQAIVALLQGMADHTLAAEERFTLVEYAALLREALEAASFQPADTERAAQDNQAVVWLLPLSAARMRRFDAAIVMGCSANVLPSASQDALFFNARLKAELGLGTPWDNLQSQCRDLSLLLMHTPKVLLSWHQQENGQPNLLAPWLVRLNWTLRQLGQLPVLEKDWSAWQHLQGIEQINLSHPLSGQSMPAPGFVGAAPLRLSASAYGQLRSCPYRFFAAQVLRLSEMDELSDDIGKRELGQWLHEILHQFHETDSGLASSQKTLAARTERLVSLSQDYFAPQLAANPQAFAFLQSWLAILPNYLNWLAEHEAAGYQWRAGEVNLRHTVTLTTGKQLTLQGRLDRLDAKDHQPVLLDYKLKSKSSLNRQLKQPGEDCQLPFYAWLMESVREGAASSDSAGAVDTARPGFGDFAQAAAVAEAAYLSLDRQRVETVPYPDLSDNLAQLQIQLPQDLSALDAGQPMPANGAASVCAYCSMMGLCRKPFWDDAAV